MSARRWQKLNRKGAGLSEDYRLTDPIGAGRNKRVDRTEPSGNDWLKNATRRRPLIKKKQQGRTHPMYRNPEHYPDPAAGALHLSAAQKENHLNTGNQFEADWRSPCRRMPSSID